MAGDVVDSRAGIGLAGRIVVGDIAGFWFRGRRDQRHVVQNRAVSGLVSFAGATVPARKSPHDEAVVAGCRYPAAVVGLSGSAAVAVGRRRLSRHFYLSRRARLGRDRRVAGRQSDGRLADVSPRSATWIGWYVGEG